MNQKKIIVLVIIAILVVVGYVALNTMSTDVESQPDILSEYTEVRAYNSDTVITDGLLINPGESIVLEGSAVLTTQSDLLIDGALGCRDGSLTLVAEGSVVLNDTIVCQDDGSGDITIVAKGGFVMGDKARIVAQGNVQIVDGENSVRNENELSALYDAIETIPDSGLVVGPFVDEDLAIPEIEDEVIVSSRSSRLRDALFRTAHAQVQNGTTTVNLTGEPIVVSGKIVVQGPVRKEAKRVVVFDFPNTQSVTVQDFSLEGPDGRPGDADTGSCDVTGKPGEDAFRFNAFAPNLTVNNFTLNLGNGGEGGEATTGDGCDDARAKGGKGGKPGNFRMIGSQNFSITGAFNIHPGEGGAGGGATAMGKVGEPGQKGGDANATGGKGADNKKKLTVSGTVAGTSNVQFGDAVGGVGGAVLAEGGKGGDADTCGMNGGPGGKAIANGGDGGDARLTVSGGAGRMPFANDIGGSGGITEAYGGVGGVGGSCDETATGGDGGKGGDASGTEGKGGQGKSGKASDGALLGDDGGDGGNGGDGCVEGKGGDGGHGGIEDGEKGEDGRNICLSITKEEDYISLLPGEIQVIQYMDYYIPIANGNVEKFTDPNGEECDGEEHWHPGAGGAVNTMGYPTPDPDPNNCGFGKTSEVPVQIIQDPNYVEAEGQGQIEVRGGIFGGDSGGEMIQIDPPTTVIPSQ